MEIGLGIKKYEIDLRPVVVQKARIIRARPRIDKWKAKFDLIYNEEVFTGEGLDLLERIVTEAGIRCGLLDNRPERGGENGTFIVTSWKRGGKNGMQDS
jgi:hypothetical protein